jgi:two-component system nitrogen regulation sensor histidine kinase NtrY
LPIGRPSKGAFAFAIGFALSGVLTAVAILIAVSKTGPLGDQLVWLLAASLAVNIALGAILAHRIVRIARQRRTTEAGARLHLRFVTLFSLGAFVPAVAVAVFLGAVLTQGVERWFSSRVESAIENAASVGRSFVDTTTANLSGEVQAMAADLNNARAAIVADAPRYAQFLALQAERRQLTSAYVIDGQGTILASAQESGASGFRVPTARARADADGGAVAIRFDEGANRIRALYKLTAYGDAYLYVTRDVDPGMLAQLRDFESSVVAYRAAQAGGGRLKTFLALAYVATASLVLLGAVWLGLGAATRIAEPIGRLADAARRVATGDLSAHVTTTTAHDEVGELAVAFNQMTDQLGAQRRQLVAAQEDAERRSRFIEAVLAGVSAGVISLDRDGRVTAANRSAAALLGVESGQIVGRRLIDFAAEFDDLLNSATPHADSPPRRVDVLRGAHTAHLSVRMSPDAETGGFVLTFDDMTELIAAQRQEAWKDVARRIAHEIKNPLTPIQLSAERLRRKYAAEVRSDPETFQRCTDTILRQVSDIGRMVDEFAAFARMPTPRMAFADMSEVARSCVFAQRLSFADVQFEAIGADAPVGLVCDERLIGQVLANLLKNAAESIQARRQRDGEPKDGRVTLELRDLDYGVQFKVSDNGLGFPMQDRHRLIEPYVTTRVKGSGLGLAIVARIVEDHGGLIELDDPPAPAHGAMVRIVLPKRWETPADPQVELGEGVR